MEIFILYLECTAASVLGLAFSVLLALSALNKKAIAAGETFNLGKYIDAERFAILANISVQVLAIVMMRGVILKYPHHEFYLVAGNALIGFAGTYIFSKIFGGALKKLDKTIEEKTK